MSTLEREKLKEAKFERIEVITGYLNDLENEWSAKKAEVDLIRKELTDFEERRQAKIAEYVLIDQEVIKMNDEKKAISERERELSKKIEEDNALIASLKKEITDLIGRKACYVGEYDTWENKIIAIKLESSELNTKRDELVADIKYAEEARLRIIDSNTELQTELTENIANLRSLKSEVEKELSELTANKAVILEEINAEKIIAKQDKEYAQNLVKMTEQRIREINEQIEKMKEFVIKASPLEANDELKGDLRVLAYSINRL